MRRQRLAVVFVTCSACQAVLGLKHVPSIDDAAAPAVLDASSNCTMPTFWDDFDGSAACAPWGMREGEVSEGSGALIAIAVEGFQAAGCVSNSSEPIAFRDSGVFVQVSPAIGGSDLSTYLRVMGSSGEGATITEEASKLVLTDNAMSSPAIASVTYDATAMAWWRLVPTNAGIEADTSPDGRVWSRLGIDMREVAPSAVQLQFETACSNCGTPVAAEFRDLDVCPQ